MDKVFNLLAKRYGTKAVFSKVILQMAISMFTLFIFVSALLFQCIIIMMLAHTFLDSSVPGVLHS